ncbi:hypothetical protein A2Z00_02575 [Candidatus Gottesmanbacteria bacterium RBG_13_45_10]|uniref:Uncharacterized protein n=1 Tax=Candidatus Gottesmanbacteria bacterium RBG_13_45_10 TaxID=1798370 RepID=A0A1F5ZG62_9BACT|nr:MAG: hypothetical protein A2Z00_02575 [Candidatus Gottesmanbacteria bacterium RBG_13_45_10]
MYLDRYFFEFPLNEAASWGYGYKALTTLFESPQYKGKRVIMSRPEFSPYIFLLFYSAYDPQTYRYEAKRYPPTADGFVDVSSFGRFEFRDIHWNNDSCLPSTILVDYVDEKSSYIYPNSQVIRLPNGNPYLQVFTTNGSGCDKKSI